MYVTMVIEWGDITAEVRACLVCCVFRWSSYQMQKVTTRIGKGSIEENTNTGESPRSLVVQSKR